MNGNDEEWSRAERVWWGGLDRGSVENRCNRPRTLCFNSLRADVCLRSGTFLHFSSIYPCTCIRVRVYTYAHERTAGPPATVHLRVHVHTYVCTTSTGTLPGIIDPRYHTDSIPARMLSRTRAYSRL